MRYERIGIIGMGFVGSAVYHNVTSESDVEIYDKYKNLGDYEKVKKCRIIFVCVSTPSENGVQDPTNVVEVLHKLARDEYKGIVVLKSTVLYGSIKHFFHRNNHQLRIVMNPEFLTQNNAVEDFKNQKCVILGGEAEDCRKVKWEYENKFELTADDWVLCSHQEAIDIKYVHNIYHAYKALFWNYVLEITGNHRKMYDAYEKIVGITGTEMANVASDGRLGFGGACFPKDVDAKHADHPHELTKFMKLYNERLRNSQ